MTSTDTGTGTVVALHGDAERDERDHEILQLRLAGLSIRRLAREFKVTDREVLRALERGLPQLTPETRTRMFREDLLRLDELMIHWFAAAKNGSASAANATQLCLRIMERRSALCGLDAPVHWRIEVIEQAAASAESSTAALLKELDRIAAERPDDGHGLIIEGEIAEPDSAPPAA
jgi:hypothetical protein